MDFRQGMHVLLLPNLSSFADARLAGGNCGFNFVCALCPAATAGLAALPAHLSFAPAVRSHRFTRTRRSAICGRSAIPSRCSAIRSGFGNTNGSWMAGKTKPFSCAFSDLVLGGGRRKAFRLSRWSVPGLTRFLLVCFRSGLDNFGDMTTCRNAKTRRLKFSSFRLGTT